MSKEQINQNLDSEFDLVFGQQSDMGLETRILNLENISAQLPPLAFVAKAEYSRNGQDLVMKVMSEGGEQSIIIKNYFASPNPQVLKTIDGAVISPQMVNAFLQNNGNEQHYAQGIFDKLLAQGGKTHAENIIAIIQNVEGSAIVIRNGKAIALQENDTLFQGDVISTAGGGKLEIVFADGTNFQIGGEARISLDQFSFDSSTSTGLQVLSILSGAFSYVSGLVAKDDPTNVTLQTPIGEIGIRGTKVIGNINAEEATASITILEGRVIYQNPQGQQFELTQGFDTLRISNGGDKVRETTISPERAAKDYDVFSSVEEVNEFLLQQEQSSTEQTSSSVAATTGTTASSSDSLELPDISYAEALSIEGARQLAATGLDDLSLVEATAETLITISEASTRLYGGGGGTRDIDIINVGGTDNRYINPYADGAVSDRNNLFTVNLRDQDGKIQILLSEDNIGFLINSGGRAITITFYKIDFKGFESDGFTRNINVGDAIFTEDDVAASSNFLLIEGEASVGRAGSNDLLIEISSSSVGTYHIVANDYFIGNTSKNNDVNSNFGFTIETVEPAIISGVTDNTAA